MATLLENSEMLFQNYEPKTQFRYKFSFGGSGTSTIPSWIVKSAKRPSIAFNPMVIDHINSKRKLLGKGEWEDIDITFYDPITPSGAQSVITWIRQGYESYTGRAGYASFYKRDITLQMLGPVGDVVEEWTLKGAFISKCDWGALDYTSMDAIAEISTTVTYDFAVLNY